MKWVFWGALIMAALVFGADYERCNVFELKTIAFTLHDPRERRIEADRWLRKFGPLCSIEKLNYIQNNRANWFGTADSMELQNAIAILLEEKWTGSKQ